MSKNELAELIRWYYGLVGNGAGGNLHIVLDDGNLDDEDIAWSIARALDKSDFVGVAIGRALTQIGHVDRRNFYKNGWQA